MPQPPRQKTEEVELNLREYAVVGGVFYLDLLHVPPDIHRIGSLVVMQGEFVMTNESGGFL